VKGTTGRLLKVDLSTGESFSEPVPSGWYDQFLAGDGLAARLLWELVPPGIDPYDPANALILAPGLFAGTPFPTGGKCVFMSKSPMSGSIAESVMGGSVGAELKRAGYDALVITGAAASPAYLLIEDDRVELHPAEHVWGMMIDDADDALHEAHTWSHRVACIGPAGERLVRFACISCEDRQAGRSGLGAVMGSKLLKAVVVRGTGDVKVADPEKFMDLAIKYYGKIRADPAVKGDAKHGTGGFMEWVNREKGTFPTHNWREGVFEQRGEIIPQSWSEKGYVKKNKACYACGKACGRVFKVERGPYAGTKVEGPEYETLYSLGGECGNPDVEALAHANMLCDQYGMDTISGGVAVGFAMELYEKGIIGPGDTELELRFGNPEAMVKMLHSIGKREGLGDVLAEGTMRAAEAIGKGSDYYAMHTLGLEFPAYDARGLKAMALGFMTSTRGGCHLRSGAYLLDMLGKFWLFEGVDRFSPEGKGREVRLMEDLMSVYDSLGVCKFSRRYFVPGNLGPFMRALTGEEWPENKLLALGERVSNLRRLFNVREGIGRESMRLPERLATEPLPSGPAEGHVVSRQEQERMLDDYFAERGWDAEGVPTPEKLRELGLDGLAFDVPENGYI